MTPEGWAVREIGALFSIQLGKMLNPVAAAGPRQRPYLGNRHVQWGRIVLDDLPTMHFDEAESEKFGLRPGDLLVCEGGEVGRSALWKGEGTDYHFQKALHRLRSLNGAECTTEYLLHFMKWAASTNRLVALTGQSSIAHLTREKLAQVRVSVPPLAEQRKIAAILASIDDSIETSQSVIQQLQAAKHAMMNELLTRGMPGRHARFKQTEIGEVPEGWGTVRLSDVSLDGLRNGVFKKRTEFGQGTLLVNVSDVYRGTEVDPSALDRVKVSPDERERFSAEPGDVLFVRSSLKAEGIGHCCVVGDTAEQLVFECHLIRVRPDPKRALVPRRRSCATASGTSRRVSVEGSRRHGRAA